MNAKLDKEIAQLEQRLEELKMDQDREHPVRVDEKPMQFKLAKVFPPAVWYLGMTLMLAGCGMPSSEVSEKVDNCQAQGLYASTNETPYGVVVSVDCNSLRHIYE